ncbi:hypothetical protein Tco_0746569 [Tanacetum coccineum]
MAESSSHNPSSPKITPKEEPVTLDRPESPNPFLPTDQIEFIFEEIAFTTNNEVALLYPSHPDSKYFREVSDFIFKFCLMEAFTRAPTQYKEYLCEFWYTAKTLDDSKIWISTLTGGIRGDIGYSGKIGAKGTLKKSFLPHRWRLLMGQIIQCLGGKTGGLDQISIKDATILYCLANGVKVDYAKLMWEDIINKLNKKTREKLFPILGKKPRAKSGLRRKQPSKHTSESNTEASKSKAGQSEKETQSSLAKDKSPSHPSPPTPVVGEMYKEAQQAAGGPTSLGATSEEGAHPQLSSYQTKSARDRLKTAHTNSGTNEESRADEISKKIKLDDLSYLLKDTRSAFFTLDSLQDEPIIVSDESKEDETEKDKDTHATSHNIPEDTSSQKEKLEQQKGKAEEEVTSLKARPSYLDINQLTELLVTSLKPELSKLLTSHDFARCLPTELKELPSKFTTLPGDIKELKQHVHDMKI